jgi:hypothetical protein
MLAPSDSFSLASLKAKLLTYEDQVRALALDLLRVQGEMQVLTAQIDTLRQLQALQSANSQTTLQEEKRRLEQIMKQQFSHEKEQRRRFQQEIEELREQKLDLQQSVLALSQRMQLLAGEIGL